MPEKSRFARFALGACAVGATAALMLPLAACQSNDAQQVSVQAGDQVSQGLTPAQRGVARREALEAAQPGFDAWKANDLTAMNKYWSKKFVDYYTKLDKQYAAEGKVRVRDAKNIKQFDVSDMNETGHQVLVDISFTDGTYFKDAKTGKALTQPTNKNTFVQLTLTKDKKTGQWAITNIIGGGDVLK